MKNIEWNRVTWYSKLLAALFFIFVVPVIVFNLGKEYENTQLIVKQYQTSIIGPSGSVVLPIPSNLEAQKNTSNGTAKNLSGVTGVVTIGPTCPVQSVDNPCPDKPYTATLNVFGSNGKISTTTVTRPDGKFVIFLDPGTYTIALASSDKISRMSPTKVSITKGAITKVALSVDSGIR